MTEEELSRLLHKHEWYLSWKTMYKTRYAYAKKRVGKQGMTRYLITERKLDQLTEKMVLERIGVSQEQEKS